jgi:signal transduction histidine kinase
LAPDLPLLRADELKTRQVLLNLLTNAVKFTGPGGTITVACSVDRKGLSVTVADTGIGIAPEDLARVLEPFEQADTSFTRRHQGTGLGLPLVKAIMESHGGALTVRSAPDAGTEMTIIFPPDRVVAAREIEALRSAA